MVVYSVQSQSHCQLLCTILNPCQTLAGVWFFVWEMMHASFWQPLSQHVLLRSCCYWLLQHVSCCWHLILVLVHCATHTHQTAHVHVPTIARLHLRPQHLVGRWASASPSINVQVGRTYCMRCAVLCRHQVVPVVSVYERAFVRVFGEASSAEGSHMVWWVRREPEGS